MLEACYSPHGGGIDFVLPDEIMIAMSRAILAIRLPEGDELFEMSVADARRVFRRACRLVRENTRD